MTAETVRALNQAGLTAFQKFIVDTRVAEAGGEEKLPAPKALLTDPSMTEDIGLTVTVYDSRQFSDRYEMAAYLNDALGPGFSEQMYARAGLWAWLALFFFDQLRRQKGQTQRSEHFIPDEWARQTPGQDLGYRHAVRTPLQLVRSYGDDFARFALQGRPVFEMGDIVETLGGSPKLTRSDAIRSTMLKLYQSRSGGVKRGAATRPAKDRKSDAGRGGLRRFSYTYVPRVKLGYDIDEMEAADIISVCGPEISQSGFAK
ncbi:MAG: hypothetical protein AB7O43_12090 [Hyphomicrobiaceae bacterium]